MHKDVIWKLAEVQTKTKNSGCKKNWQRQQNFKNCHNCGTWTYLTHMGVKNEREQQCTPHINLYKTT